MSDSEQQAVAGPAGPVPLRRPRSIRRTATLDGSWVDGFGSQLRLVGNARDAVTSEAGRAPEVVATAHTDVGIGPDRTIEDLAATPDDDPEGLQKLVGCRGGGYLRAAIDEALPGLRHSAHPLHLLLDDISGMSLISGFAWSRWRDDWAASAGPAAPTGVEIQRRRDAMEGVCIGFAPGSRALTEPVGGPDHRARAVDPLTHPDDPEGWHELPDLPEVSMRRARFIDVWRDGDLVLVEAGFQDSAGDPGPRRVAVHEYRLAATIDAATLTVSSIEPDARVLPFLECPGAVATAGAIVGEPLVDLRAVVLERLSRTRGCTHLNDALRSLAEVPALLGHLDRLG